MIAVFITKKRHPLVSLHSAHLPHLNLQLILIQSDVVRNYNWSYCFPFFGVHQLY